RQNFLGVVADRRDDAHPGDDDPPHARLARIFARVPRDPATNFTLSLPDLALSSLARLGHLFLPKQPDLEVIRTVDDRAVGREPAVGDAEHELGAHDPLGVDSVNAFPDNPAHLTGELHLPETERPALARRAEPAQEETQQLPE